MHCYAEWMMIGCEKKVNAIILAGKADAAGHDINIPEHVSNIPVLWCNLVSNPQYLPDSCQSCIGDYLSQMLAVRQSELVLYDEGILSVVTLMIDHIHPVVTYRTFRLPQDGIIHTKDS